MWYNMKQNLENGFAIKFSFRFKRLQSVPAGLNATQLTEKTAVREGEQPAGSTTNIGYVFQNCNEISSWRKDAPISLSDLKEYLCIKVGMTEASKRT